MTPEKSEVCPWCGDEPAQELHEAWGHEFLIDTCCEGRNAFVVQLLQEDPKAAAVLMRDMGAEDLLGQRLRNVISTEPSFLLDFRISVGPIKFSVAKQFVLDHHQHCRPPAGWRFGFGCWNGPSLVGVAMVGRPVARMIDANQVVEVNRLCLDRTLPAALRFNASSKLLSAAAKEAKTRGFQRSITYTLDSENGASMRASGWVEDGRSRGGSWTRAGRDRPNPKPTEAKVRWARALRR